MKKRDFYLVDSWNTYELDEAQKEFVNNCLTTYHDNSSLIDKVKAIRLLTAKSTLKGLQYEYNKWLFDFLNHKFNTSLTEEENHPLRAALGGCYHTFGVMHFFKGDYSEALDNYLQAAKIRETLDNKEFIFTTYQDISLTYKRQGNISTALEYHEKSNKLIAYIKNKKYIGRFYVNLAGLLREQGNHSKSLTYFYQALEIFEEGNHDLDVGVVYHNIGKSLFSQNELGETLKYYDKALKLYKKNNYGYGESGLYADIGAIHEKEEKNDIALEHYNKALQIQKRLNMKQRLINSHLKIGIIYEKQGQLEIALQHYYDSFQLSEKTGSKDGQSNALSKISILEIQKGNINKASQQVETAFTLAQELKYLALIKAAAAAKASLAIAKGDYRLAYEMEKLKHETHNKIQNENIRKDVIKQQFKYEHEKELLKKDMEIEFEKKNAEFIQEQSDILTLKNQELSSKNKIINEQVIEMNLLIQQLQESNESLKQFASVAAHDLKAPLRNIQGFSQILHKKYAAKFPKEDMEFFMFIVNSCKSLKELIDGLLNYSRISNMEYQPECVDLAEIVSSVESNLSNIITETGVDLHISDNLPKVFGRKSLLFQVFLNFINNAIKFRRIEEGLQSSIWVNAEQYNDNHIKISIKDNGIGIEQKHQDRVFGIFNKLHSSSEYEGNGIGLSVCKKIIERFGGEVWLESEKDVGTTFFFTLKLYDETHENTIQIKKEGIRNH